MDSSVKVSSKVYADIFITMLQVFKTFFEPHRIVDINRDDIPPHAIFNIATLQKKVESVTGKHFDGNAQDLIQAIRLAQKSDIKIPVEIVIPNGYKMSFIEKSTINNYTIGNLPHQKRNLVLFHELSHILISYHPRLQIIESRNIDALYNDPTIKSFEKEFGKNILQDIANNASNIVLDFTIDTLSPYLIKSITNEYSLIGAFNNNDDVYLMHSNNLYSTRLSHIFKHPIIKIPDEINKQDPQIKIVMKKFDNASKMSYNFMKNYFSDEFKKYEQGNFSELSLNKLRDIEFYSMFASKNAFNTGKPFINSSGHNLFEVLINDPMQAMYNFYLSNNILMSFIFDLLYIEGRYTDRKKTKDIEKFWHSYLDNFAKTLKVHTNNEQTKLVDMLNNNMKSIISDIVAIRKTWESVQDDFKMLQESNTLFLFMRFYALYGRNITESTELSLKLANKKINALSILNNLEKSYESVFQYYNSILTTYAQSALEFKKFAIKHKNPILQQMGENSQEEQTKKITITITFPSNSNASHASQQQNGNIQTQQNNTIPLQPGNGKEKQNNKNNPQQGNKQQNSNKSGNGQSNEPFDKQSTQNGSKQNGQQNEQNTRNNDSHSVQNKQNEKQNKQNEKAKGESRQNKSGKGNDTSKDIDKNNQNKQGQKQNRQGNNSNSSNKDAKIEIEIEIDANGKIKGIKVKNNGQNQVSGGLKAQLPNGEEVDINSDTPIAKRIRETINNAIEQALGKNVGGSGYNGGNGIGLGSGDWMTDVEYDLIKESDMKKILSYIKNIMRRDNVLRSIIDVAKKTGLTGIVTKQSNRGKLNIKRTVNSLSRIIGGEDSKNLHLFDQTNAHNVQGFNIVLVLDVSGSMNAVNSVVSPFTKALYLNLNKWAKSMTALIFSQTWRNITKDFTDPKKFNAFPVNIESEGGTTPFDDSKINDVAHFLQESMKGKMGSTIVIFLSDGEFYMNIPGKKQMVEGDAIPYATYSNALRRLFAVLTKSPVSDVYVTAPRIGNEINVNEDKWENKLLNFIMRDIRKAIISKAVSNNNTINASYGINDIEM